MNWVCYSVLPAVQVYMASVLLSVTFDPQHDQPDVLAKYAHVWQADPRNWHFLTGALPDVSKRPE